MTLELRVDGIVLDTAEVEYHYQEDPFPGGHRFELRITDLDLLKELRSELDALARGEASRKVVTMLFNCLRFLIGTNITRQPRYWLNNIDPGGCTQDADGVTIRGDCSPHHSAG